MNFCVCEDTLDNKQQGVPDFRDVRVLFSVRHACALHADVPILEKETKFSFQKKHFEVF